MGQGYTNKILRVDLSTGKIETEDYPENLKSHYLGGSGAAARILYDEVAPEADALSPDNVLCVFTGPYTGTSAPFSGRYSIASKSPLTGGWGEASCSGYWGPELKFAGFDGIVVKGKAESPVYLHICDGKALLLPGNDLWGKTTIETEAFMTKTHGEKTKVLSIGPAGEKLVRFACIISDEGRAAGRGGLGAVMGAKGLKAIAVQGSQRKLPVADNALLKSLIREYTQTVVGSMGYEAISEGTASIAAEAAMIGDFPSRNWQYANSPAGEKLDFKADYQKIFVKKWPCYKCPMACGRWVKVEKEIAGVKPFEGHGPEYETVGVLGGAIENDDIETVAAGNHLCNSLGLDTISAGGMIAFAYEAFEKGLLSEKDVGFELKWGDGEAMVKLLRMIGKREGVGHLLGEGPIHATKVLGKDSEEFCMHVKGMNVPAHDPRVYSGVALEYAVSNRGACHLQGFCETWQSIDTFYAEANGLDKTPFQFWGTDFSGQHTSEGKGKALAVAMAACNVLDALPVCKFMFFCDLFSGEEITNLTHAITGMDISRDDLTTIGERLVTLKRAFNIRCGYTRADDKLPERLLTPAPDADGRHAGADLELQMKEFYSVMDWDWDTGKPTKEKLIELGLEDVAHDLWK